MDSRAYIVQCQPLSTSKQDLGIIVLLYLIAPKNSAITTFTRTTTKALSQTVISKADTACNNYLEGQSKGGGDLSSNLASDKNDESLGESETMGDDKIDRHNPYPTLLSLLLVGLSSECTIA